MIVFNETIDKGNHQACAERHISETVALIDDRSGWRDHGERRNVAAFTRELETSNAAEGGARRTIRTVLARTRIPAPRAKVYPLVSHPETAPDWDSSDRGFEWVEVFGPDDTVFRNYNQPLFRKIDSVLYRISRPEFEADRSLYCARSVISSKCPPSTKYRRLYQQIFCWAVRDLDQDNCELLVLASTPEHMLPMWLQRIAFVPGWRHILTGIRRKY